MGGSDQETVAVIDSAVTRKALPLIHKGGTAHAVLWPGNGACYRTVNILDLDGGGATIDLSHAHECVYYISEGGGLIRDLKNGAQQDLTLGSMIHIGPGDPYRLEAGEGGMTAIGGCVPVDPALYEILSEGVA